MNVQDMTEREIEAGNYLIDSRGKVFLVADTEVSFQKNGLVRAREMIRKLTTPREQHTYCRAYHVAVSDTIPAEPLAFYEARLATVREAKRVVMQQRHARADNTLKQAGLRPK